MMVYHFESITQMDPPHPTEFMPLHMFWVFMIDMNIYQDKCSWRWRGFWD